MRILFLLLAVLTLGFSLISFSAPPQAPATATATPDDPVRRGTEICIMSQASVFLTWHAEVDYDGDGTFAPVNGTGSRIPPGGSEYYVVKANGPGGSGAFRIIVTESGHGMSWVVETWPY